MTNNQNNTPNTSQAPGEQKSTSKYNKVDEIIVRISAKITTLELKFMKYKFFKDLPVVMRRFLIIFVILFGTFFTSIVVLGIFFQIITLI
jgi:hypothetical protein